MPSDIIGQIDLRAAAPATFRFREGPVFTNLLLADEINRTPPKTQAALLEAMEERQVTVDGQRPPAARSPFLVVATQNPIEYEGTYPLPEAQLDRFLFKLVVGYPTAEQELAVLARHDQGLDPHELLPRGAARSQAAADLDAARARSGRPPRRPGGAGLHRRPGARHPRVAVVAPRRLAPGRGHAAARVEGVGVVGRAARSSRPTRSKPWPSRRCVTASIVRPEVELEGVTADGVLDGILATVPVPR